MGISVIGVVFDFDDTLAPDSTTKLLQGKIDPKKFWEDAKKLVLEGYDPAQAFLKLFLDNVGAGRPLGELTNRKLYEFGATLDSDFLPGIPELFDDLRTEVSKYRDIQIEFYIISGGLQPIIEGTLLFRDKYVNAVYACRLAGDSPEGVLRYVQRCVTFTEKTRYLFEINKGLTPSATLRKPHLVNKAVPLRDRRIPFRNMIYVGDGLTDVPCFSLVRKGAGGAKGGIAFGVFDRERKDPKTAFREFLKENRVSSLHFPRYREQDELGSNLRGAVASRCAEITIGRSEAEAEEEEVE